MSRQPPGSLLIRYLTVLCLFAVLASWGAARADDEATPLEAAVDAVRQAHASGDASRMEALAGSLEPDAFLVAEILCLRDADAARSFAAAAKGAHESRLAQYVGARSKAPATEEELTTLLSALGEQSRRDFAALLRREHGPADTALSVALALARAEALLGTRALAEAAPAALASAQGALRIGWWRAARRGFALGARAAHGAGLYRDMLGAYQELEKLESKLEQRQAAAQAILYQGNVRMLMGQYRAAIQEFARARPAFDKLGSAAGLARVANAVATAYRLTGEHSRALSELEYGLLLARSPRDKAFLLTGLGQVRAALGEHAKASVAFEEALATARPFGRPAWTAKLLGNVGAAHKDAGNHELAHKAFTEALATFEEQGDQRMIATARTNLGHLALQRGKPKEALALCERALEAAEQSADPWLISNTQLNVAEALLALKRYDEARLGFERNVRLAHQLGARKPAVEGLLGVARCQLAAGDAAAPLASARAAIILFGSLVRGLAEGQDAHARALYAHVFEVGVEAAAALGDVAAVVEVSEAGRAMALLESLEGRDELRNISIPKAYQQEETAARADLAEARVHHRRAVEQRDMKEIGRRREVLDGASARLEAVVARIRRAAKQGSALAYPEVDDLETIRGYARPGEAFVLYALTTTHYVGVVIDSKQPRIVTLGTREDIDGLCVEVARACARGGLRSIRGFHVPGPRADPKDQEKLLARLRTLLVKPLLLGEDTRRLLLSPTGSLFLVPLSALLGEREVAYVPSGTLYGVLRPERDVRGKSILALGGVDYSSHAQLSDLPGTKAESKAVGDEVLIGTQASEAGLRTALIAKPRWRGVHFACHGLLDMDHPMRSGLALTEGGGDDGMLSVLEVFTMKVPADLVVLSACETGRGRIYRAEGILGLTRAFMYAGAPRVLCSLWKVDDDATRALMTRFYELWNPEAPAKGISAAAALRKAQEYVRAQDKWKSPYYWAAWVLWGLPD